MEYFFITLFQAIGFLWHVNRKINQLDKDHPEKTFKEIKALFIENETLSFFGSALILLTQTAVHAMLDMYMPEVHEIRVPIPFTDVTVPWVVAGIGIALFLGYFGQMLMYKVFGKAEQYLGDKLK